MSNESNTCPYCGQKTDLRYILNRWLDTIAKMQSCGVKKAAINRLIKKTQDAIK